MRAESVAALAVAVLVALFLAAAPARAQCDDPDVTDPELVCPRSAVLLPVGAASGAISHATPSATDGCGVQSVELTGGVPSGTVVAGPGTAESVYTATDLSGNTDTCSVVTSVIASRLAQSPSGLASNSYLGDSVSVSADGLRMVSGARGRAVPDIGGTVFSAGAAFVYERGDGDSWVITQELNAADPTSTAFFGRSVAISGDGQTIAVGADFDSTAVHHPGAALSRRGAVYVFARDNTTGVWTQQAKLLSSAAQANAYFGNDVALSADGLTLLVGEYNGALSGRGRAYVFWRASTAAAGWSGPASIGSSHEGASEYFAISVSLSADGMTAVMGSPYDDPAGSNDGSVQVYERSGTSWVFTSRFSLGGSGTELGRAVSIGGEGLVIAAGSFQWSTQRGIVGIWRRSSRASNVWVHEETLPENPLDGNAASVNFGRSVSLSRDGSTLVVGAYRRTLPGASDAGDVLVYRYRNEGPGAPGWSLVASLSPRVTSLRIGESVSVSAGGEVVASGASYVSNTNTGRVYAYDIGDAFALDVAVSLECGDGIVGGDEECDLPGSPDLCTSNCTVAEDAVCTIAQLTRASQCRSKSGNTTTSTVVATDRLPLEAVVRRRGGRSERAGRVTFPAGSVRQGATVTVALLNGSEPGAAPDAPPSEAFAVRHEVMRVESTEEVAASDAPLLFELPVRDPVSGLCDSTSRLYLFNTDTLAWERAAPTCSGDDFLETPPTDANECVLTTHVCHLTDFAVIGCSGAAPLTLDEELTGQTAAGALQLVFRSDATRFNKTVRFVNAADAAACNAADADVGADGAAVVAGRWTHARESDCADTHTFSAAPGAQALVECGFRGPLDEGGDVLLYEALVEMEESAVAATADGSGQVFGTGLERRERSSVLVRMSVPKTASVNGSAGAFGEFIEQTALTRQQVNMTTLTAAYTLAVSVQYPYEVTAYHVSSASATPAFASAALPEASSPGTPVTTSCAASPAGAPCQQSVEVAQVVSDRCVLDATYTVALTVACRAGTGVSCDTPSRTTTTASFSVQSSSFCPVVAEVASASASLTSHSTAAARAAGTVSVDFVAQTTGHFRAALSVEAGLAVRGTTLASVSVTTDASPSPLVTAVLRADGSDTAAGAATSLADQGFSDLGAGVYAHDFSLVFNNYSVALLSGGTASVLVTAELDVEYEAPSGQSVVRRAVLTMDASAGGSASGGRVAASSAVLVSPSEDQAPPSSTSGTASSSSSSGFAGALSGGVLAAVAVFAVLAVVALAAVARRRRHAHHARRAGKPSSTSTASASTASEALAASPAPADAEDVPLEAVTPAAVPPSFRPLATVPRSASSSGSSAPLATVPAAATSRHRPLATVLPSSSSSDLRVVAKAYDVSEQC